MYMRVVCVYLCLRGGVCVCKVTLYPCTVGASCLVNRESVTVRTNTLFLKFCNRRLSCYSGTSYSAVRRTIQTCVRVSRGGISRRSGGGQRREDGRTPSPQVMRLSGD